MNVFMVQFFQQRTAIAITNPPYWPVSNIFHMYKDGSVIRILPYLDYLLCVPTKEYCMWDMSVLFAHMSHRELSAKTS